MKIEKLDYYGRGITHIDGKVVFVEKALPEEEVDIETIKEKKKSIEAVVKRINKESKNRITGKCKYYGLCGGCNIMHMNENYQIQFKNDKIKDIFNHNYEGEISIKNIITDKQYLYRNKIVLHVKNNKLGLYMNNSNELVEIDKCLLVHPKINKLIEKLKQFITKNNINEIMIRIGNKTEEVLLSIKGKVNSYEEILNDVDCLVINDKIVSKKKYIISIIGNKKYKVSKNSFFQVNGKITEYMYDEISNIVKEKQSKNVLDLYCGTGTIGIYISDYVDKVCGVEVVASAVSDALENKKINDTNNIEFICDKVENIIDKKKFKVDTIIVDPPRAGLHKKVINEITKINPKTIIYISCNPLTLVRDVNLLSKYKIEKIQPYDMFPNTYHCESITVLERK